jgi:hypothetical protein
MRAHPRHSSQHVAPANLRGGKPHPIFHEPRCLQHQPRVRQHFPTPFATKFLIHLRRTALYIVMRAAIEEPNECTPKDVKSDVLASRTAGRLSQLRRLCST